jgi:hypothetical protein
MAWIHKQNDFNRGKKRYQPIFKQKYISHELPIIRSSWELKVCKWLDKNENVISWASEPFGITYYNPWTQKRSKYFPDFFAKIKDKNGDVINWIIEVKPQKDSIPPKRGKGKRLSYLQEQKKRYMVNMAKWSAAKRVANRNGWKFQILTEKEIFGL